MSCKTPSRNGASPSARPLLAPELTQPTTGQTARFIIESDHTFTGLPRDPVLAPLLRAGTAFEPFLARITHKLHAGRALRAGENPFALENDMRRAMTTLLRSHMPPLSAPAPMMLFSDVDEIPSAATVALLGACDFGAPLHLGLREYVYSFEWPVANAAEDDRLSLSWRASARVWPERGEGAGEFYGHGKVSERVLADAGWHCSWCFRTLDEFAQKAKGYSHTDRLGSRGAQLLRPDRIQQTICHGWDFFNMLPESYSYRDSTPLSCVLRCGRWLSSVAQCGISSRSSRELPGFLAPLSSTN